MRILFDHGTPRGLAHMLEGHSVQEARELGRDTLSNGELLSAAETASFDVLVSTDQNLPHQQNLAGRKIGVVLLGSARWRLIEPMAPQILASVNAVKPGTYLKVNMPRG